MSLITVYRPVDSDGIAERTGLAPRNGVPAGAVLMLIDNGKVHARQLLEMVAEGVRARLPIEQVEIFTKPSSGSPIDAEQAIRLAARAHLIITGVGD